MELTIVSWNMLVLNKKLEDALEFIQGIDFDVFCLQEVPADFLERLRSLAHDQSLHIAVARDSMWVADGRNPDKTESGDFLVIISKHPFLNTKTYSLPPFTQSWRVIAVRTMMKLIHPTRVGEVYNRELLSADIQVGSKTVRIFCVHFPNIRPEVRRTEFDIVAQNLDPAIPAIVCGDFNVLDHWTMKPLNWLQGGRFHEMFPWYDERIHLDPRYEKSGFQNPLSGLVTMKLANGQLDHILVPKSAEVLEKKVIRELHGSDHNPVLLKIRFS